MGVARQAINSIVLLKGIPLLFSIFLPFFLGVSYNVSAQSPLAKIAGDADSLKMVEGKFLRKLYGLPIITFAPETSLQFGAVGVFIFRRAGVARETQLSSIRSPISYTINNQFRAKLAITYYSNANKHMFTAMGEYFEYPLFFYGLGNATAKEDEEIYTSRTLLFGFTYLKSLTPGLYLGLGYNYLQSRIIKFVPGGQLSEPGVVPGNNGSMNSGFNINMRYDNRDNHLNANSGLYLDFKVSNYEPWMGSEYDFTQLFLDYRQYFLLFDKHVLAVQLVLTNTWGGPSFETMALLGGKSIMRGHYIGRYRDNNLYAAQVEYRLPLGREKWNDDREEVPFRERWGMVGFFGLGDVYGPYSNSSLGSIKSSAGIGIRYLILPKERINIRLDFGFGDRLPGFYFSVSEAF